MEWFPGRFLGRSNREEASVFVKSRSADRPVLTETPQPVTRIERQGRRTHKDRGAVLGVRFAARQVLGSGPNLRVRRTGVLASLFGQRHAQAAPHIPRPNAAVRAPRLADLAHLIRLRRLVQPVRYLHPFAHAQVVDRQHVRPTQREDQEHLARPAADAVHRRQVLPITPRPPRWSNSSFGQVAGDANLSARSRRYTIFCRETTTTRSSSPRATLRKRLRRVPALLVRLQRRQHAAHDRAGPAGPASCWKKIARDSERKAPSRGSSVRGPTASMTRASAGSAFRR